MPGYLGGLSVYVQDMQGIQVRDCSILIEREYINNSLRGEIRRNQSLMFYSKELYQTGEMHSHEAYMDLMPILAAYPSRLLCLTVVGTIRARYCSLFVFLSTCARFCSLPASTSSAAIFRLISSSDLARHKNHKAKVKPVRGTVTASRIHQSFDA